MSILNESLASKILDLGHGAETNGESLAPQNGLSYLRGSNEPPLVYATIPQLLREAVSRFGPRDAMIFTEQGIRMSYYELDRAVDELASGLLALGLAKGDRVGIWSPNRSEWVLTQFATARIGVILVNINPAYRLNELEYALNKVGCKALITARAFKSSDYLAMIRKLTPELETCKPGQLQAVRLPELRSVIVMDPEPGEGVYSFDQVCKLGGPAQQLRLPAIDKTLNPDDAINIQFTSGTTGTPKGATLSHYNIVNNARFSTNRIHLTDSDRLAIPVPLYHCFGMVLGALGAVSTGAAMVFPGEAFDAAQTLDVLSSERCTAVYGVPTMFVAMLEELEAKPRELSSLRTGIMAGAPCPVDVMQRVNSEMNMQEVTICYGTDPFIMMPQFLSELKSMGFSGVQNFPTIGLFDGSMRQSFEETGMGYGLEVDMITQAHQIDLLTTPYVFNPDEAVAMTKAGADIIVAHMGVTTGGAIGATSAKSLDDCVAEIDAIAAAARSVREDVIVLSHGGPISMPDDAAYILQNCDRCHGFYGASSAERLPAETAIRKQIETFKALQFNPQKSI